MDFAKTAASQAEVVGKDLNENFIKPTAQKLQDPSLRHNISAKFQTFGHQVIQTGDKGIDYLSKVIGMDEDTMRYQKADAQTDNFVNNNQQYGWSQTTQAHQQIPPTSDQTEFEPQKSPEENVQFHDALPDSSAKPESPSKISNNNNNNGWDVDEDEWASF